ncbi:MlaD family protein [Treponema parvum]|uniref:MlaD family protein n=1 Tax=Treponema parvum TaxID=138851 RepID=UPI001AEC29B8|nr:MlaD family protein [Treponema parvum]QTQ17006.1 MCE family protein [Treponema parvum]
MKFKIRYADQIVGFFAVAAAVALVASVFLIGSKQRWFSKDYYYITEFESGSGLSAGMPVLYKGFTVGKIKSIRLNSNDSVEVQFYIYDTYYDRVREGSVVEFNVSPIGLGNQFLFYPGNGTGLIEEGELIPRVDSAEGRKRVETGIVTVPKKDDTISNFISQANRILTDVSWILSRIDEALEGRGSAPLTNTIHSVELMTENVSEITQTLNRDLSDITQNIKGITDALNTTANSPDGIVPSLVDPNGKIFPELGAAVAHTSAAIENLEKATAALPSQFPQISGLVSELQTTLQSAQDVLEALKNNPLLKRGVPDRVNTQSGGTSPRDIEF